MGCACAEYHHRNVRNLKVRRLQCDEIWQTPRLHPVGHGRLDDLLGGGLPLGSVCELAGAIGSGLTSIALSLLAVASTEGACAYIDVSDTLSPQAAAAAGVELSNLLWMRLAAKAPTEISRPALPWRCQSG